MKVYEITMLQWLGTFLLTFMDRAVWSRFLIVIFQVVFFRVQVLYIYGYLINNEVTEYKSTT